MHADTVYIFIVNHFRVRRNKNLPKELKYMKFNLLLVMSEQNLFCPTKMVSLVGHIFFQEKKKLQPCKLYIIIIIIIIIITTIIIKQ